MNIPIEDILQQIYNSEITIRIGWMWDGGLDYSIGSTSNDIWDSNYNENKIVYTEENDIRKAIIKMAQEVAKVYPKSELAKWMIKRRT